MFLSPPLATTPPPRTCFLVSHCPRKPNLTFAKASHFFSTEFCRVAPGRGFRRVCVFDEFQNRRNRKYSDFLVRSGEEGLDEEISYEVGKFRILGFLRGKGLGIVVGAAILGAFLTSCKWALAQESVSQLTLSQLGRGGLTIRDSWPKILQVLRVFKEQGLILTALLGLSAFFSMAETSITTLWPWKVYICLNFVSKRH